MLVPGLSPAKTFPDHNLNFISSKRLNQIFVQDEWEVYAVDVITKLAEECRTTGVMLKKSLKMHQLSKWVIFLHACLDSEEGWSVTRASWFTNIEAIGSNLSISWKLIHHREPRCLPKAGKCPFCRVMNEEDTDHDVWPVTVQFCIAPFMINAQHISKDLAAVADCMKVVQKIHNKFSETSTMYSLSDLKTGL